MRRLQTFMRRVTRNGTRPGYAVHLDIQGFFFNIDKEILYQLVAKRIRHEALLWLARTIIFHDCTQSVVFKGSRGVWRHIPPHKTLVTPGNVRGLPIGNLSSQFFSNVYLNELDQFVKHHLKGHHYVRYSDDFVLVHEDPSQLLAWQAAIEQFLHERLRLRLTDPSAKPRPIKNGVDFLGYIVRPAYLLVRRRVMQRIKARLASYQARLVRERSGCILFTHYAGALEQLRASWASSVAHMKMAHSYRLRQALLARFGWLAQFFDLADGLLTPRQEPPAQVRSLNEQYHIVARACLEAIVLFQVGCFYELYDDDADRAVGHIGLRAVRPRRGFRRRCGFPLRCATGYLRKLLVLGLAVCVVRETAASVSGVKARRMAEYWKPLVTAGRQPAGSLAQQEIDTAKE